MHQWLVLLLSLVVLVRCGSSTDTESSTSLACYATATLVSGNLATANSTVSLDELSVSLYNGNASAYYLSVPGLGTVSTTSTTYTYSTPFTATTSASGGSLASLVTVQDSDGNSTSCSLYPSNTTTTTTTTTATIACTLQISASSIYLGQTLSLRIVSGTGEALLLNTWDAGEPWSVAPALPYTLASGQVLGVSYGSRGTKTMLLYATSASTGAVCNGGAPLSATITVY